MMSSAASRVSSLSNHVNKFNAQLRENLLPDKCDDSWRVGQLRLEEPATLDLIRANKTLEGLIKD